MTFHSQAIILKSNIQQSTKRGITRKIVKKIFIFKFDLDIHNIHLHTIPSFSLTFPSQVIIWKQKIQQIRDTKRGITLVKIVQNKIINIEHKLDTCIHKIHLHTTPSLNLTFRSQVIIWKPKIQEILSIKRGITLVRIVEISSSSNLTQIFIRYIIHTTPSFSLTFRSHVIIRKPKI